MDNYKPCNKYWGLGRDIECKHGILIDADEYHDGVEPNIIRQPCSCNPKFCKTCNGVGHIGENEIEDCPDCNCGWVGGIEFIEEHLPYSNCLGEIDEELNKGA